MKRKRGQFYLLAAIVIIVLISGFAAVSNYTQKKSSIKLYDLKNELGIESGEVLDYGTTTGDYQLENFLDVYDAYAGEGKNISYIFGDEDGVSIFTYTDIPTGEVGVGESSVSTSRRESVESNPPPTDNKIEVTLPDGSVYEFDLKEGENFYFIISEEVGGEQHVVSS